MIKIPKHIQNLQPYQAGKSIDELIREKRLSKIVKLASNENPLGPSPKAIEAIKKSLGELHRYTSPSAYKLVNAIADKYNKSASQIITGSGSDSLLQYIITTFSEGENELLTSQGTFIGWYVNVNKYGFKSVEVPMKNYHFDLENIAKHINSKTKIIYLANPNNPTGTMFTKDELDSFLFKVPENVLVILDEAYTAYAESHPDYPNGLDYEKKNMITIRTLSKSYGLAGLRIGFAFGDESLVRTLYKVKLPFEPNYLAQQAAIAAIDDREFLKKTITLNRKSLDKMIARFNELGIEQVPTAANFILLIFPSEDFAFDFNKECLKRGLILRHVKPFGIPNGIRINSGTIEETEFALNIINEIYPSLLEKYKITINE